MGLVFNNGNGGAICDKCRTMVFTGTTHRHQYRPYVEKDGEFFCAPECGSDPINTPEAREKAKTLYLLTYSLDDEAHLLDKQGDEAGAKEARAKRDAAALEYELLIESGVDCYQG